MKTSHCKLLLFILVTTLLLVAQSKYNNPTTTCGICEMTASKDGTCRWCPR